MWKYVLAWLPMLAIAIANGTLRQWGYAKYLGELRAHQLSTVTGIVLFGIYMWSILRWLQPTSDRQALAIGALWLILTLAFEFIFGRYVAGHSWRWLLQDYNLFAGRLWVLVLLWLAIAPLLFYRLQK